MTVVKRLGVALLALAFIFAFIPGAQAKSLRSTMRVNFYPYGPDGPIWAGPIEGDIDGYMEFFAVGPFPPKDVGIYLKNWLYVNGLIDIPWAVHFFEEEWYIYTEKDGELLIAGNDKGCTVASNWKFRMNGEVTFADGDYEYLIGHQVHMHGQITWELGLAEGPIIIT